MREELEAFELLKKNLKSSYKRSSIKNFDNRLIDVNKDLNVKIKIDFHKNNSNSIKSLAVKKTEVKVTT